MARAAATAPPRPPTAAPNAVWAASRPPLARGQAAAAMKTSLVAGRVRAAARVARQGRSVARAAGRPQARLVGAGGGGCWACGVVCRGVAA